MLIIPLNSSPDRRIQILLGFNLLSLRTYWNASSGKWYMDIGGSDGVSLARGLALVPNINVLELSPELTRRLGQFRLLASGSAVRATDNNLGTDMRLWWFAPGEFEAAEIQSPGLTVLPFDVSTMYSLDPPATPKRLRLDGSWTLSDGFTLSGLDPRL